MANASSVSERRAFPRIRVDVPVEVFRGDYSCGEPIPATLLNISQDGALMSAAAVIPIGEWILMRPDRRGAGFGTEVTAVVERHVASDQPQPRFVCRFPQPLDYSTLRLFT
jgi:hypothetical protein